MKPKETEEEFFHGDECLNSGHHGVEIHFSCLILRKRLPQPSGYGNGLSGEQVDLMNATPQKNAVTLRDIAAATGLSLSATSLALRGSAKISSATRDRVERVARELGYAPNPLAAAFQSEIRKRQARQYQASLAWINDRKEEHLWDEHPLYMAARRRCEQLGYVLDVISVEPTHHMDDHGLVTSKFLRILRARGIHGVILPELHHPALAAEEWGGMAVVLIGHYEAALLHAKVCRVREVIYHGVQSHAGWNTRLAYEKVHAAGARRIGLALSRWSDRATDFEASAQFLEMQRRARTKDRIPVHVAEAFTNAAATPFLRWVDRHRPDTILCAHDKVIEWLRAAGKKVPDAIRVAHINNYGGPLGWSGIDERPDRIAEAAVDLLSAHLIRNETGIPPYPKTVLIRGEWKAGQTA